METRLTSESRYRKRLIDELIGRQRRNAAYSLRSFARDLGISSTALSEVLNAKRNLSKANLLKVADRLSFSPSETTSALGELKGISAAVADDQFVLLEDDVFRCMSEWYYFAILSLAETGKAKADAGWIAEKLGITAAEAKDALERLKRLKMIQIRNGKIHYDGTPLRTSGDVPSAACRALQHHHLRLAGAALEREPVQLRDMTSMTMVTKPERIAKAKEMIKSFRRKLCRYLEEEGGEEVYVVAVQLFPVTKRGTP
jgi:uncharacterized protein (TIGR02147 family)